MTTARDVIRTALQEIGAYASGEPPNDADAELCLTVLNDMLGIWSNESLMTFAHMVQTFDTVNGTLNYSIGPATADVTGARPLRIDQAWIVSSDGVRTEIDIVVRQHWSLLNREVTGQPSVLFYEPLVPNGSIRLWPTPDKAYDVRVLSYLQFTAFAGLGTEVVLPLGYVGALKKNLAVEIAPFFGKTPQPITVELAAQYKGRLKVTNIRIPTVRFDSALLRGGRGNIFTG